MRIEDQCFNERGTFEAWNACCNWLKMHRFSVGQTSANAPVGILFTPNILIAKWRNMNDREREGLHAVVEGDRRTGPVVFRVTPAGQAFLKDIRDRSFARDK